MKKKHPCGSFTWEVLRTGQDIRLRCEGCGRMVLLSRHDLERSAKKHEKGQPETPAAR